MKIKSFLPAFVVPFLLLFLFSSFTKNEVASFAITISVDKNRTILEGEKGCAFTQLAFTKNITYIYKNGMLQYENEKQDAKNTPFIFKLSKYGNKVILQGVKGTTWKILELPNIKSTRYIITEQGMQQKK